MFTNRFDGQAAVAQVLPGFYGAFNLQRQRHTRPPQLLIDAWLSSAILMWAVSVNLNSINHPALWVIGSPKQSL